MSRGEGEGLDDELRATLADHASREAVTIATVDASGHPRFALLSTAELVVPDTRSILIATWPSSTTSANLVREGRASLGVVSTERYCTVTADVVSSETVRLADGTVVRATRLEVRAVRSDVVPYATLSAGVRFELADAPRTDELWREIRRMLAQLTPGARPTMP